MDTNAVSSVVSQLHTEFKKNFVQSFDLVVNLKDLNLKKPDEQVDFFTTLPKSLQKKIKVCGLVGPELIDESKEHFDKTLTVSDFESLSKQDTKKLADEFDFFVAQATIMPKVAATFGRTFGPKNKMPNPKSGCVVPPKANLKPLYEKLQNTVRVKTKNALVLQNRVGTEEMEIEAVAENIMQLYDSIVHHLPKEENNVSAVYVKKTMSKAVRLQ